MECAGYPERTLGEVGEELVRQLDGRRFPLGGTIELTERCNLDCLHCYIRQPASSGKVAVREMTLDQIGDVLDQLADAGCLSLLLTGGEPLLRPDFCDIWRYAKRRGMLISLFTNGTLLTRRIADCLAEWRPMSLEITLYGATQETYERLTQVPGSYARCMRGIRLALDRGLRLDLKSVLMRANRHELEAMKAYAEQLGVGYRFDGVLWPRLDGERAAWENQRLSPAEVVALDQEYPERQQERDRLYRDYAPAVVRNDYVYTCLAGQRTFHIDSAGRLSLCMMARRPSYDLLQSSFREAWESLGKVLGRKRSLDTPCRTCTAGILCPQCPGWSQLVHGDDETPVGYVCEIGRLRAASVLASARGGSSAEQTCDGAPARHERNQPERSEGPKMSVLTGPPD